MRSENGIPRPFQPNNLAQKVADLERQLQELKARRTFVSVERIVEGGTLNPAVGTQITETVQKDLVVERENIAEGALSVVGETVEVEPKRLTAQLRTVERDIPGGIIQNYASAPSLAFTLEGSTPTAMDPGVYSLDGESLTLASPGSDDSPWTLVNLARGDFRVFAENVNIGADFEGGTVKIGNNGLAGLAGSPPADVNLLGNVKVNGKTITPRPWTLIPMPNGQTPLDGNHPACRLDSTGEFLEFTGGVLTNNFNVGPGTTFLTIPDPALRPSTYKNFVVATSKGPAGLTIANHGGMYLNPTGVGAGGWIDLSQLRFVLNGPR